MLFPARTAKNDTRERVYQFIRSYTEASGYPPSIREIAEGLGLRSYSTIHYHLEALRHEKRVAPSDGSNRSIRLLDQPTMQDFLAELGAANPAEGLERIKLLVTIAETFQ